MNITRVWTTGGDNEGKATLKELKMCLPCYNSVGDIVRGVELVKLVNIEATKAWNTTSSSRDKSSDIADDLVICLKMLVLADILFESISRDKSNTIRGITPIYELDQYKRRNISVHVTSH